EDRSPYKRAFHGVRRAPFFEDCAMDASAFYSTGSRCDRLLDGDLLAVTEVGPLCRLQSDSRLRDPSVAKEDLFERAEEGQHVSLGRRLAHQPDPPGLPVENTEPT